MQTVRHADRRSVSAASAHASTRDPAAIEYPPHRLDAQTGLLTLGLILSSVARDFGVSTATAGQLRTLAGLAGGIAALVVAAAGRRVGIRWLLLVGNWLLALGAVGSAAAPNLIVLAIAQAVVGAAAGLLISGGQAAAAPWAPAEQRAAALAWASLG